MYDYKVFWRARGVNKRNHLAGFNDSTDALNYAHGVLMGRYRGDADRLISVLKPSGRVAATWDCQTGRRL